jgi:hypothetical protein
MDFSFQSESVGGGRSWVSTEKNGTNGAFSGSSEIITDAIAASFVSGDVGKFLIVKDNANPATGGIYKIIQFISTTQVMIDFRAGYGEYPATASGLSWWICGGSYQVPIVGEYVRLQSRHTTGWAIQITYGDWPYYGMWFMVAPAGNWSSNVIGVFSDPHRYSTGWTVSGVDGPYPGRTTFWAEGDYTDCEWLNFWRTPIEDNIGSNPAQRYGHPQMLRIARLTPVDVGHVDDELILLQGPGLPGQAATALGDRSYSYDFSRGLTYSRLAAGTVVGYLFDYSLGDYTYGFARWQGRQVNWRRGGKIESFVGTPYVIDENNLSGRYQIFGYVKGHWSIPIIPSRDPGMTGIMNHQEPGRRIRSMVPMNMG